RIAGNNKLLKLKRVGGIYCQIKYVRPCVVGEGSGVGSGPRGSNPKRQRKRRRVSRPKGHPIHTVAFYVVTEEAIIACPWGCIRSSHRAELNRIQIPWGRNRTLL